MHLKGKEMKNDTVKINKCSTLMIAHRGVSGIEKENTIAAFIAAGNRSYYGIETDVHVTADGKYIIIHDSNTKRVSGVSFVAEETDFDTLRSIALTDMDKTSFRIDLRLPSLEEYISVCKKYNKKCILELKEKMTEKAITEIVSVISDAEYLDNTVFISFCADNLVFLKKQYPEQEAQFLFFNFSDEKIWDFLVSNKIDIDVQFECLTKEIVEKAHSLGLKVNCWTVDSASDAERLVEYGVDFITSNILE